MGGQPRVTFGQLRPGEWVVAVDDATVGRVRGDEEAGFQARLDAGEWLPTVYADISTAVEVIALEAALRARR
ncbi:hypothetical protein [Segeticoccus rhizosphaerae]|jgi:hypothetical protein|uniref:hypothetical protein n=1 Tax=Segeticoccus rhizosphaerae TaxID=1104777 RepID=UPI0010C02AEE|nr:MULTISPECIES: hypothetical protein [Intrasporangiaceae]